MTGTSAPRNGVTSSARTPHRLPVVSQQREPVPCLSCGLCCTYVAVEIDQPTTLKAATDILWYLYHQNICVYVEDDEWLMQIEARCQHFQDDHKCAIYETRPQVCREYDETACEINAEEVGTVFYTPREFLVYLQQRHKRIHTLVKKRYMPPEELLGGPPLARKGLGPYRPRYESLRARANGPG